MNCKVKNCISRIVRNVIDEILPPMNNVQMKRDPVRRGSLKAARETMAAAGDATALPPDVPEFWPDVANDLRQVTWAHAVNSRAEMEAALTGDVMMLEADVSVQEDGTPIMAHPPATASDLTLQLFLDAAVGGGKQKGVKLDFKSTAAFEAAVPVVAAADARRDLNFPLWLNADVVAGPGGAAQPNVSAPLFLSVCAERFPGRTLSLGWTTGDGGDRYTEQHVEAMQQALRDANVTAQQPLTFAVRAAPAARSRDALLQLLQQRPQATLTLWGAAQDQVDNQALLQLAQDAGFNRVYVDLPSPVPGLTPGTTDASTSPAPPPAPASSPGAPAAPADAPSAAPEPAPAPAPGSSAATHALVYSPLLAVAALVAAVASALRRF